MRTVYAIRDTAGVLRAEHIRIDLPGGRKTMYWRRPDGSTGLGSLSTPDLPLYGSEILSDVPVGDVIIVTEGERPTDALHGVGFPAVGTVTGSGSTPGDEALAPLLPYAVVLWPDHDRPGHAHMNRIAWALARLGAATPPRAILPDTYGRGSHRHGILPRGYDAADYVAGGGTRVGLRELVLAAIPWPLIPDVPRTPPRRDVARSWATDDNRRAVARSHLYRVVLEDQGPPARQAAGGAWWRCPFHTERTPSFKVSLVPDQPYYRCFGCGARGDVFTYLRDRQGTGYGAALRALAPGLGAIPEFGRPA